MIIEGSIGSKKTDFLIKEYCNLLNNGIDASKILVLVQNSNLKNQFIEKTLENLTITSVGKLQVYSFYGLVYNSISDNWSLLENRNTFDNPKILPTMTGLEVSQFILKDILKTLQFKGYNSKKSLLHQLFRRYSLIVQNNLSDDEVDERSKILKEAFADDAKTALKRLLKDTLSLRAFDYLRQALVFNFIYKNTDYFSNIEYLILDDGDEITPACFDFINNIAPQLKDVFIAYDKQGGSRTGYLSADKNAVWEFEQLFKQKAQHIETITKLKDDAETIFHNVTEDKTGTLKYFSVKSPSKRSSMIDLAIKKVEDLLAEKIQPSQIAIVTPLVDDMLKFSLKQFSNIEPVFLSGNEKLIQNRIVKASLTILKLNTNLKQEISEFDIRVILSEFLGIPVKYCREILTEFDKTKTLIPHNFFDEEFNIKYKKLTDLVEKLETSTTPISEQVCEIYDNIIEFNSINPDEINKFNFFIKQLRDFESIYGTDFEKYKTEIINQIENSVIAENPYSILNIKNNQLVVATPQKIIDNQIITKYQIWLDVSSNEWVKSDTGPLYNAWVFQKGWDKDSFTIEDNIKLSKDKTARVLRKLTLCANDYIYAYSSLFDGNGVENFGGIEKYLNYETEIAEPETIKPIIPRPDQAPVLAYKTGQMGISAVPGAGKTTILLALILKLLDRGINPERIFVMTYMDSAARNFREKIKNIRQNSRQIPNISTIHGLALRILKEDGNFERLGLPSDFDICDDTQRSRVLHNISSKFEKIIPKREMGDYDRAISVFKLSQGTLQKTNDSKIQNFKMFFEAYQQELSEQNLIDYDDILIAAVKLLKENSDILAHYQEICEYIIEDEAQDSSSIQQELIKLLSGKHKNLIRCGDVNQAITTTFSNADVEGFRQFLEAGNNVSMDCSQRCAKDIWTLANDLIKHAQSKPESANSFYPIFMKPVENKNPVQNHAVRTKIFEDYLAEKNYIKKVITETFKTNPKTTAGILLRNNSQVSDWVGFINDSGLKSITRSECLEQKMIFKTIFAILKMIISPFDNANISDNYEILAEAGFYKPRRGTFIRNTERPFVEMNPDDIDDGTLGQFYWDLNYWLSMPYLPAEELAVKIGLTYFSSEIEKSNVYLISTLIKRISINYKNIYDIVTRLGELAKKPALSGFKFFSEEDESNKEFLQGKVQIMTMHKSKGDEFDIVFIPELSEEKLALKTEEIKLKNAEFTEDLKSTNPKYKHKDEYKLKTEALSENLRLLYVAITRAKKQLFVTVSKKGKSYGKIVQQTPSIIFEELLGGDI